VVVEEGEKEEGEVWTEWEVRKGRRGGLGKGADGEGEGKKQSGGRDRGKGVGKVGRKRIVAVAEKDGYRKGRGGEGGKEKEVAREG